MPLTDDNFLKELQATFAVEAREHLQVIVSGLLHMESAAGGDSAPATIETMFRAAHSLKGAARAVDMSAVESQAQVLEDMLARLKRDGVKAQPETLNKLHAAFNALMATLAAPGPEAPAMPHPQQQVVPTPRASRPLPSSKWAVPGSVENAEPALQTVRVSVDRLEARLLQAEEMLGAKAAAARQLGQLREAAEQLHAWQRKNDAMEGHVRQLRRWAGSRLPLTQHAPAAALERFLDFHEGGGGELRSLQEKLQHLAGCMDADRQVLGKQVNEAVQGAKSLLLLPFASISGSWPKLVRDLCQQQGKEADLNVDGESVELDKRILEEIKDPLIHILRNSVGHGLEPAGRRTAAGKPQRGTITLQVRQLGSGQVQIVVADDGAGIDLARVRATAVKQRLLTQAEADQLTDEQVASLVFRSAVTTSPRVTELSGRGLGLAIVQERTQALGGEVVVETRAGKGTSFRIVVPATRAAFRGIVVQAGHQRLVLPTTETERVTRVQPGAMRRVPGGQALWHDGRAIPLLRMTDVLQQSPTRTPLSAEGGFQAVIVNGNLQQAAFVVDAVVGEQQVLVKPLTRPLSRVRNVAAATVLATGEVAVILNVAELVRSALVLPAAAQETAAPARSIRKVLVVEDSITSRMLIKSILESAGYQVNTAVDGLEAFSLLRAGRYDLVVSDVEMPRLDGFGLTERIRSDSALAALPVVLVTSLEAREHRERGVDVGANAYVVKSNFDQSSLLETVARLI